MNCKCGQDNTRHSILSPYPSLDGNCAGFARPVIDELTFRSYVHNRMQFPDVQPERWIGVYGHSVVAMEERYLKTFILKLMEAAEEFELSSVTGIDVAARNDGLSCPTVTYGATGGEAPAIASPLQKFTGERATDARRSDEASISIEKPELERRAYPAVSEMIAANPAHMLHASGGCLEGRPPSRAMTSSVILSLPVHPMGREGVSSGVDGHAVRTERRPSNLEARAGVGVFEASSGILSGYQGPSADSQILKSFSCVRRGIDGFISAVGWVVDRETAAAEVTA